MRVKSAVKNRHFETLSNNAGDEQSSIEDGDDQQNVLTVRTLIGVSLIANNNRKPSLGRIK